MALGFAGYLLFMKPVESIDNKYYGEINGQKYLINDESAFYYYELWRQNDTNILVEKVLSNQKLWGSDLSVITEFAEAVKNNLNLLMRYGAKKIIENIEQDKNNNG
jgi:tagaturonate reductase